MTVAGMHGHTEYSALDGLSTAREAAERAAQIGSPAEAITDHGGCYGHVQWQDECDRVGVKPIFGIETYFQPDRRIRPAEGDKEAQQRLARGRHLILLAQSDKGLHDMWAASTEAFVTGKYHKPRMDWDLLDERGGDLIATTSCLGGMVSQDLLAGRYDDAWRTLDRMKATFPGRTYLEIQANELPDQRRLNEMLVIAGEQLSIPLVAACDAHYPSEEDAALHKIWMMCQSGKGKDDYWHFSAMLPEQRMREMLGYLDPKVVDASMRATLEIADRCTARIEGHSEPPVFTPGGTHADDARQLRELCEANWHRIKNPDQRYRDRMEFEFEVVAGKGLAGCYLIVEDIVRWVKSQGWLVGPGRGSAPGSLMSYLCDITSLDPIRYGLMFERFLTPGRISLPDFDLDFASSRRAAIQDYAVRKYGADHVVRVGTVMRYQAKGILNKLFSVLEERLSQDAPADARKIAGLVDDAEAGTAGLGLPWDELTADQVIAEFVSKYELVFRIAGALHSRVYALGKHPAGLIINPGVKLAGTMPMRTSETGRNSDLLVSQWDFRIADKRGDLKLDFLTLRTLDSVERCVELVRERTGQQLDLRSWDAELDDPQVYDMIGTGNTLGIFQLETSLCVDYSRRHKPRDINALADITTYIRPGPRNSGGTERYLRRRAGLEPVTYPHPLLAAYLERSYGELLYQEDVLYACKTLAGYDDLEADQVRKILGKKLTERIEAAGEEFTRRCTERGHDEAQIRELWARIAEFGKYAFNRAHATSYAVLSYWTAWLKEHYPTEYIAAVLSTLTDKDRMPPFAIEARRLGIAVLPPDVRFSGGSFTASALSISYGLSSVKGVGAAAIATITAHQPYASAEDFLQRSGADAGVAHALARAGALDALASSRKGLVRLIEDNRDGSSTRCVHKDADVQGPNGLPCSYPWDQEPLPPPQYGKPGKDGTRKQLKVIVKDPPATCRTSCRQYTPPALPGLAAHGEYAAGELFRMDAETYGTWMHPAPFDRLDGIAPGAREQAREMARMVASAPEGTYPLAAVYGGAHAARTRAGSTMWWVSLVTEVSCIDMACFSPRNERDPDLPGLLRQIRAGTLVYADVTRRSYTVPGRGTRMGWRLSDICPIGA